MLDSTTSISSLETEILDYFKSKNRFIFRKDRTFFWSSSRQEIHFKKAVTVEDIWQLLHEIAHACLGHQTYNKDIGLVHQEMHAWHYAKTVIGPLFKLDIEDAFIEDHLDSYRDWLHERSKCPMCTHTGIQQTTNLYQCINCLSSWSVNDARLKKLRRVMLQDRNRSGQQVFAE